LAVDYYADANLRERVFRSLVGTRYLLSFAMTEAGAGSDLANIDTRAQRTDSGWVICHLTVFAQACDFDLMISLPKSRLF
jgi:alkylation response protein AidB-like acyl-CoA dehydrogenase